LKQVCTYTYTIVVNGGIIDFILCPSRRYVPTKLYECTLLKFVPLYLQKILKAILEAV